MISWVASPCRSSSTGVVPRGTSGSRPPVERVDVARCSIQGRAEKAERWRRFVASWRSQAERSIDRPFSRHGVPVLNRSTSNPSSRRLSERVENPIPHPPTLLILQSDVHQPAHKGPGAHHDRPGRNSIPRPSPTTASSSTRSSATFPWWRSSPAGSQEATSSGTGRPSCRTGPSARERSAPWPRSASETGSPSRRCSAPSPHPARRSPGPCALFQTPIAGLHDISDPWCPDSASAPRSGCRAGRPPSRLDPSVACPDTQHGVFLWIDEAHGRSDPGGVGGSPSSRHPTA